MQDYEFYCSLPLLQAGSTLKNGQYEIIDDTVNAGGFGRIYRAYANAQQKNERKRIVAIKEFCVNEFQKAWHSSVNKGTYTRAEIAGRIDLMRSRFQKEAELLAKLNEQHDRHVPWIHEKVFDEGNRLFYAMTFIDGPTLTQVVEAQGPLDEVTAIDFVVQIGKVLYKAHRWGLIHCDISPNNIMLQDNFAILVDFGNAKSYDQLLQSIDDSPQALLEDIELAGTPGFSPPINYIGSSQGDIYSLAATLFYLLTGTRLCMFASNLDIDSVKETLENMHISKATTTAIVNALDLESENCTTDARKFLAELPYDIVFDTLLNYNDYDYNRRS